jgi:hypothetical protein
MIKEKQKNKVGRPKKEIIKEKKMICIYPETYEFFSQIGEGNFSKGIETVYMMHKINSKKIK